eukprot:m.235222 g.235222  ORF g.235222 m.235222 type:complete len:892 (+) comp15760_c0_seq2:2970-5645(+)
MARPVAEPGSVGYLATIMVPLAFGCLYQVYINFGERIIETISQNQFLEAAIGTGILSGCSWLLYSTSMIAVDSIKSKTLCSISIRSQDEGFKKVIEFIGKKGLARHGSLIATTHKKKDTFLNWKRGELGHTDPPKMEYRPDDNDALHVLRYKGARILMRRRKGETVMTGYDRRPLVMESLTLSCWGLDNSPIQSLIDDAMAASHAEETDDLKIYVQSNGWPNGFVKALSKKPRPLDSVILDQNLAADLISDAREFLTSGDWYEEVGIPYRRGYLLYGPPGCGKTSFCQALAGALKQDVCMLTLSDPSLNDSELAENLREAPSNSIIMLEDVDAVFADREAQGLAKRSGVTFSGLLNAIDGVASQEGRLFFMTTNHPEKLDPALVRPGRCDVKVELKRASRGMARRLFERFFPDDPSSAEEFSSKLPEYEISMAQLQGYLLEYKGDNFAALNNVPRLLRMSKPQTVDRMSLYEHLHRVGLDLYAPLFETRGYRFKADIGKLNLDSVLKWSPMLRCDEIASSRLGLLLEQDEALMLDYQRADLATVKDLFMSTYLHDAVSKDGTDDAVDAEPSRSLSTSSACLEGLSRFQAEPAGVLELSHLGDALCAAVQRDGKAAASIWLLRRHLQVYHDQPHAAVANAGTLLPPQDRCPEQLQAPDDISTAAWLRRCCLEHLTPKFTSAGYVDAKVLYTLDEEKLKHMGITDVHELAVLTALLTTDREKRPDVILDFTSPDVIRLRELFFEHFGNTPDTAESANTFAWALCDSLGRAPTLSIGQVKRFLRENIDPRACAGAADAFLQAANVAAPASAADSDESAISNPEKYSEVTQWLKPHGLEHYAKKFYKQGFCTLADLALDPKLECGDLEELGIKVKRDSRYVAKMIADLPRNEATA